MKLERSDIKFPLWRKKVDSNLFSKLHTPIPNWCGKNWELKQTFGQNTSKKSNIAQVSIKFDKKVYPGFVTYSHNKDTTYQLYLSRDFGEKLKGVFLMSYMRSLEQLLRKEKESYKDRNLEDEIPFWEFLDIEFDVESKTFYLKAHYFQKPIFPELFKEFIRSHLLKEIENKLNDKGNFKFIKENWKAKGELKNNLERSNIIYYLMDSKNKLLYIGEAEGTKRILQTRVEIPDWDYFRIDVLPSWLSRLQRLELERLVIRSFASLVNNCKNIPCKSISEFSLVNKKIDR